MRLYLTRQPPEMVQLPTSTFPDGQGNVFEAEGPQASYTPTEIGDSEVLYGSSGSTGQRAPGRRSLSEEVDDDSDLEELYST